MSSHPQQPTNRWTPTLRSIPQASTESLLQADSAEELRSQPSVSSLTSWETISSTSEPEASSLKTTPTPIDSDSPPTSPPPEICAICMEPISDPATITPCTHIFDLECICNWVIQPRSNRTTCPLCKAPMTSIQHYSASPSSQLQTISMGQDGDEAILPGMSGRQIHAANELRRLRALEPRRGMFKLRSVLSDFWVKSGEWFVFVSEYYEIEIEQEGLVTRSRLETTLSVQYMHKDHFDILPENRKDREALEAFAKIKGIIGEHVKSYMPTSSTEKVTIEAFPNTIDRDDRGIRSLLRRSTTIMRRAYEDQKSVILRRETNLTEEGPAYKDSDYDYSAPEEQTAGRLRREGHVQAARADIQLLMRNCNFVLDRATTNLLEPIRLPGGDGDNIWWRGVDEILNYNPFRRN